MKKIVSIITASVIAASALPIVNAAQTITADEVKEIIYSTGLRAYPELWDMPAIDINAKDEDVLTAQKKTVKDIINVYTSYAEFTLDEEKCAVAEDPSALMSGEGIQFIGFDDSARRVVIIANKGDAPDEYEVKYSNLQPDSEESEKLDFAAIANALNAANIGSVTDIKLVGYGFCSGIYVKDAQGNEYAVPDADYSDIYAEQLGREVKSFKRGEIMSFADWYKGVMGTAQSFSDFISSNIHKNSSVSPETEIRGDEIRDTDTRAPYIGTESKFGDVSGDLVSYVNELYDLGIITGYEDGTFRPENTITRGEAASMLARMLKYEGKYDGRFNDVNADDWFADDIAALADKGIISGYDENTFAPYNEIKYQEVMKILVYALGYANLVSIDDYPASTNVQAMKMGLTDGITSFDTVSSITRGDMAVMLSNALDTHLMTMYDECSGPEGISYISYSEDLTLIDYINGRKLNGTLRE